jgi:pyruvate formate lyase activating enzyme
MNEGIIFDIKKYAIHDGPGIRTTVFFKGCPLRCPWCHNPEGQAPEPEIMLKSYKCIKDCSECLSVCEERALTKADQALVIDREKCDACGKCAKVCSSEAIEIVGRKMNPQEVMEEVEKDIIFHDDSGGGVTFSGGEPLFQPDFLSALLIQAKEKDIHTTVDTCGYASSATLEKISDKVDLFLYDIKMMDDQRHKKFTGESNKLILSNLKKLAQKGKRVIVRIPLIPGVNDDEENIRKTAKFIQSLKNIKHISLLPYHKLGQDKHRRLSKKKFRDFNLPLQESIDRIKKRLEDYGFIVTFGE